MDGGFQTEQPSGWYCFKQIAATFPSQHTVDGRNPAPPKKPRNDDSPVNTNKQWLPMVSKWCRISSIHSTGTPSLQKPPQPAGISPPRIVGLSGKGGSKGRLQWGGGRPASSEEGLPETNCPGRPTATRAPTLDTRLQPLAKSIQKPEPILSQFQTIAPNGSEIEVLN